MICTGIGSPGPPLHDDDVLDGRRVLERLVGRLLQRHDLAAPISAVGGNQHGGVRVVDAVAQRLRAEAAEDDAVHRAEPCTREHRDRQLRDERQIQRDAIALAHAERFSTFANRQTSRCRSKYVSVRRSPGSPSQIIAALLRRAERTCRSRQLTLALICPPTNHFACGGCQSRTFVHGAIHSSSEANRAQNASGSRAARRRKSPDRSRARSSATRRTAETRVVR